MPHFEDFGASHVFVGRPSMYAAAIGGLEGVLHAIDLLREEIGRDMAPLGCADLSVMASRFVE